MAVSCTKSTPGATIFRRPTDLLISFSSTQCLRSCSFSECKRLQDKDWILLCRRRSARSTGSFDPTNTSLESGEPERKANSYRLPLVRYTKQLHIPVRRQ